MSDLTATLICFAFVGWSLAGLFLVCYIKADSGWTRALDMAARSMGVDSPSSRYHAMRDKDSGHFGG